MTVTLPQSKLDALVNRIRAVESDLATGPDRDSYVRLSREFSELQPVVEAIKSYQGVESEITDLDAMLADTATDPEMRALAEIEKPALAARREELAHKIRLALIPKDAMDERNVILEIRAGTGGDEASLFAGDLFRMYERYAARSGWKVEIVSASEGSMGGYKEIIAEVKGRGAFAKLKFESGVHRVQRVPDTEGSGRIHTSAATVAVLPEAEEVDMTINDGDIRVDTMRAGGAGGQHVNKTESAIRSTHLPTGIVVMMQEDRSQHRNRAKAMAVLRTRLYDHERQKLDSARAAARRGQVGSGDRSERIRTYNFPQARVSDHRINLTLYKLPQILEGEALGEVIDALVQRASGRAARRGRHMMADLRGASVAHARRVLAEQFREAGIDTPELDARILIGHALGLDHTALATSANQQVSDVSASAIERLAAQRLAGEPVARIVGEKEFFGLPFTVTPAVLVPRPETETIVELALSLIDRARPLRIADLGTGSGAILLALLSELPLARGVGTDIAVDALDVARLNARRLGVESRANFVACDYATALSGDFDLVVSNPPYVATHIIEQLEREVRDHDPRHALDGGADGLAAYRAIAAIAAQVLKPAGHLVTEIGAGQENDVSAIFAAQRLEMTGSRRDLSGIVRALAARPH